MFWGQCQQSMVIRIVDCRVSMGPIPRPRSTQANQRCVSFCSLIRNCVEVKRAIVIVGMHRSGTSAITRVLSLLGAALPRNLMQASTDNPAGFWEPQRVADLNDEILQNLDSDWDDVFAFCPRKDTSAVEPSYFSRAVCLLEHEFNGSELIVLKEPRISVLATFWDRALRQVGFTTHYVVMVRNPLEVAESLLARDGFPAEKTMLLWSAYMLATERDTRKSSRNFIMYSQLMQDWRAVIRRIEESVGVPLPRDAAEAAVEIDSYLDEDLRHYEAADDDFFTDSDVPYATKTLYRVFSKACFGAEIDETAIAEAAADLTKIAHMIAPMLRDLRLKARSLATEAVEATAASAEAESRANVLAEQLEMSRAEHRVRTREIGTRAVALEEERDRLRIELGEEQRQLNGLMDEFKAAEAKITELITQLGLERELKNRIEVKLKRQQKQNAASRRRSREREAELTAARKALSNNVSKTESLLRLLAAAQSAARTLEQRRAAHFRETAILSRLLMDAEQMGAMETAKSTLITAIYDFLLSQPRWWYILSNARRSKLQRARLRRLGLFDGDLYLRDNPDVAAAGEDPLHHYVHHGIGEQRKKSDTGSHIVDQGVYDIRKS